jgi:hypothetical protein
MTATLRLHFREPTIDTNRPIADGSVPVEGFALQLAEREADADAWDCGFAARMLSFVTVRERRFGGTWGSYRVSGTPTSN